MPNVEMPQDKVPNVEVPIVEKRKDEEPKDEWPRNGRKAASARLKAEIAPEELTAVVDTRERQPLDLAPLRACYGTLPTGDYSLLGLEHVVAIERKSLPDLLGCVGRQRRRFDREVQRLLAYPVRALVVEASWTELEAGKWEQRVRPTAVIGSCLGWVAAGLPVLMASGHRQAGRFVSRLLWLAAQRRWRENRALLGALSGARRAKGSSAASVTTSADSSAAAGDAATRDEALPAGATDRAKHELTQRPPGHEGSR
jgi:ERCC4-type nuclease